MVGIFWPNSSGFGLKIFGYKIRAVLPNGLQYRCDLVHNFMYYCKQVRELCVLCKGL